MRIRHAGYRPFIALSTFLFLCAALIPKQAAGWQKIGDLILVEEGDTLSAISFRLSGDPNGYVDLLKRCVPWSELKDFDLIFPGMVLDCSNRPQHTDASGQFPTAVYGQEALDQLKGLRSDLQTALCEASTVSNSANKECVIHRQASVKKELSNKLEMIEFKLAKVISYLKDILDSSPSGFWDIYVWPIFVGALGTLLSGGAIWVFGLIRDDLGWGDG